MKMKIGDDCLKSNLFFSLFRRKEVLWKIYFSERVRLVRDNSVLFGLKEGVIRNSFPGARKDYFDNFRKYKPSFLPFFKILF